LTGDTLSDRAALQPIDVLDVEERTYKEALQATTQTMAKFLLSSIGGRRTAASLGLRAVRPVKGWANGTEVKQSAVEHKLRVLYRVTSSISEVYSSDTAAAFLQSTNPQLDDRSPLAVLATSAPEDGERAVLAATRALLEG